MQRAASMRRRSGDRDNPSTGSVAADSGAVHQSELPGIVIYRIVHGATVVQKARDPCCHRKRQVNSGVVA